MPTLVIFIALAIILAIILAVIVLIPWLRADNSAQNNQLIALNIEVFKERLEELKADFHKRHINDIEFKAQKTELERQLLLASDDNNSLGLEQSNLTTNESVKPITTSNLELKFTRSAKARLTLLICIPLLIILGYFITADRSPVMQLWQSQDELEQVAEDLLTGKVDAPPEWASTDLVSLMAVLQTNVHHHAFDAKRWTRLADILLAFEATQPALEALDRAYRLEPNDEEIAFRLAQTNFYTSGGILDAKSKKALNTVLVHNPNHQRAQLLMAIGEVRAGNFDEAEGWIAKLRTDIQSKEGDHSTALQSLDQLSQKIVDEKQRALSADTQNGTEIQDSDSGKTDILVTVTLNSSLIPLVEDSDILYVTVKQSSGGAPLAVKRLSASEIKNNPKGITLKLNDDDAMMPTHTVSKALKENTGLVVTARISKSGQAISESGDLSANDVPLSVDKSLIDGAEKSNSSPSTNTNGIRVTTEINQQVP